MNSEDEESSEGDTASVKTETTTKSEKRVLLKPDKYISNSKAYKVYMDYACKLKRQDVPNKFYIIQLLQKNKYFYIFSRWGSYGMPGRMSTSASYQDVNKAIELFEKRFTDKTGIEWRMRNHFDDYKGRYIISSNYFSSESLKSENDPLGPAINILKKVCFEININKSNDKDLLKQSSTELFKLFPSAFKRKLSLDSNDSIIRAQSALNEWYKEAEEEQDDD